MIAPKNATYPILIGTILALVAALAYVTFKTTPNGYRDVFTEFRPTPQPADSLVAAAAAKESSSSQQTSDASTDEEPPKDLDALLAGLGVGKTDDPNFFSYKAFFQEDLKLPNPAFDTAKLKQYAPINYRGPGRPTFAAYMSTRNSTIHDPYFCGAQQIAYRLLWDPRSRSTQYPFTVFVAPFIPQEQRDLLSAAGALVRELPTVEWHSTALTDGRWRDLFSKLNVWNQTEFSRVALLDTDAFPLENIDAIFDAAQAPEVDCDRDLLTPEDLADPDVNALCKYVYAGVHDNALAGQQINGGAYVLKPSAPMHRHLLREMAKDQFDDHLAEQSFLNVAYRPDGPFPATLMDRKWNGFIPQEDEEGKLKIIHDKLWVMERLTGDRNVSWAVHYFNDTWDDMLGLYESAEFEKLRAGDDSRARLF